MSDFTVISQNAVTTVVSSTQQGPQGPQGPVAFQKASQFTWTSLTAYNANDIVTYAGSLFLLSDYLGSTIRKVPKVLPAVKKECLGSLRNFSPLHPQSS